MSLLDYVVFCCTFMILAVMAITSIGSYNVVSCSKVGQLLMQQAY